MRQGKVKRRSFWVPYNMYAAALVIISLPSPTFHCMFTWLPLLLCTSWVGRTKRQNIDSVCFYINVKPCTVLLLPSSIIAVIFDEAFTDMQVFTLVLIPPTWAFHSILLVDFLSQIDSHTFLFAIVIFHKDEFSPTLQPLLRLRRRFSAPQRCRTPEKNW